MNEWIVLSVWYVKYFDLMLSLNWPKYLGILESMVLNFSLQKDSLRTFIKLQASGPHFRVGRGDPRKLPFNRSLPQVTDAGSPKQSARAMSAQPQAHTYTYTKHKPRVHRYQAAIHIDTCTHTYTHITHTHTHLFNCFFQSVLTKLWQILW